MIHSFEGEPDKMTNWLQPNPFSENPYKPPAVGHIVRYVGSQHPELAGMEGIVTKIDVDRITVEWKGFGERGWFQPYELKVIRQFSKRFRY